MRILPVSLRVVLVELADLGETLALFASLQAEPLAGVDEVLPAARTLMIRFQPEILSPESLAEALRARDLAARPERGGALVEVPTVYDGEDLAEVAALTGLSVEEVIRRHAASEFTVAFSGFAPGFGYLVGGDETLHVPRRQSPRTRIPAGSVALAGPFSGVYPQPSPGGWQLIGTTPVPMWDLARTPPALFQPGDRVRFVPIAPVEAERLREEATAAVPAAEAQARAGGLAVLAAPMPALFQDRGRFGETRQGVSASGALDGGAMRAANRLVGNRTDAPVLEITGGGFRLEARASAVVAIAGAPAPLSLTDAAGRNVPAETWRALALEPGDRLEIAAPKAGVRTYLALRGGFAVEPVLGSASTDTLAHVGPPVVTAGAVLRADPVARAIVGAATPALEAPFLCPTRGETVVLDVVMGPRTDWFTEEAIELLASQVFEVTPQSNRVGIRLEGAVPLSKREGMGELPSEGTATGAIQVPHSGQPVLFLADHPLTGGYPVIATVAEYHLDLAGQIPVHARIRFRPIRPFAEIGPLADETTP
ncbi:urea amidolyase family protein [Aureimonas sp. AU40]|uniref:5-oxoprolinase subunit B/C family protein n=1 Tax=Aureimonas sp. AU40 TaxID=1637747 RepID=UPI0007860390|nr:urea amidolyase family protein [Aureimonas sp. AU40]